MRQIAIAVALALALLSAWWLSRSEPAPEPRVVEPGEPLPMDEAVQLRWVDEETGEEEVWTSSSRAWAPWVRAASTRRS